MSKKILIWLLATVLLTTVSVVEAQQAAKVPRLGFLAFNVERSASDTDAFFQEMRRLGWVDGQNIAIEYRNAQGKVERLPGLAAELVGLKVDMILASSTPAALAARQASATIPIVFTLVSDPVGIGLVASLARPGGIITGVSNINEELSVKRLELLKETFPRVSRVAVLFNPADPISRPELKDVEAAARILRLQLKLYEARDAKDLDGIAAAWVKARPGALFVVTSQFFAGERARVFEMAARSRLPTIFWNSAFVDAGGLMSYGANVAALNRRAAYYVDRILKGTKPADLPVERPMRFEFVINLKTAKQIGVTIPPNVLVRADRVIQ